MTIFDKIRVVPFSKDEYTPADSSGPPLFTWREYYGFRNDIVRALRVYGTVGPMGEMPIRDEWEASEREWEGGASNPDFFVVADMWNGYDRWNRIEAASALLVTTDLLRHLIAVVQRYPGWCVYLALTEGGLTVLGDRILFEGGLFVGVSTVEELGERCAFLKQRRID
jgi:hypothetical protein